MATFSPEESNRAKEKKRKSEKGKSKKEGGRRGGLLKILSLLRLFKCVEDLSRKDRDKGQQDRGHTSLALLAHLLPLLEPLSECQCFPLRPPPTEPPGRSRGPTTTPEKSSPLQTEALSTSWPPCRVAPSLRRGPWRSPSAGAGWTSLLVLAPDERGLLLLLLLDGRCRGPFPLSSPRAKVDPRARPSLPCDPVGPCRSSGPSSLFTSAFLPSP